MIVVAESGSTKCDWLLSCDNGDVIETHTVGFNPFFFSTEEIFGHLQANPILMQHADKIEAVFFYGAGCSSEDRNAIVLDALRSAFPSAECSVNHDLYAAAFSTYQGTPAITCIIGTGSNSCFYDGKEVHEVVPALGFILGDEGSGSYFGKRLVSDFLYHRLPAELDSAFKATYPLSKEDIFNSVYGNPHANVFLASFMKFMVPHREHSYIQNIVYHGLKHFAEIHIQCYPNYRDVPVHFVGSVAHFFGDIMQQIANELGFNIGIIDKNPAHSLLKFHLSMRTETAETGQ
jgi:N-acetylglucosamine kinase-like BadF-type ATPase